VAGSFDRTDRESSMIQLARWLVSDVGDGQIFTKQAMRAAFPAFEQIDRRMRDLRKYGWIIHTNREDATLRTNELRLVMAGQPVWDKAASAPKTGPTSKERRSALSAASFMCQDCGTPAGVEFLELPYATAMLSVSIAHGRAHVRCQRCKNSPAEITQIEIARLGAALAVLTSAERAQLRSWLRSGRSVSPLDKAWSLLSRHANEPAVTELFSGN
jgi:ribosomal protein S14